MVVLLRGRRQRSATQNTVEMRTAPKFKAKTKPKPRHTLCYCGRRVGGTMTVAVTRTATCQVTFHNYLLQSDGEAFRVGSR